MDRRDPAKQLLAREFLTGLPDRGVIVVSSQVVNEVAANLVRKFKEPASSTKGLIAFLKLAEFQTTEFEDVESALDLMEQTSISYWDGLMVSTALRAGCREFYTEDLQHGQDIRGLRILNPFA
jgi:predicted nucleic acid-binding protein